MGDKIRAGGEKNRVKDWRVEKQLVVRETE